MWKGGAFSQNGTVVIPLMGLYSMVDFRSLRNLRSAPRIVTLAMIFRPFVAFPSSTCDQGGRAW